VPPREPAGTAEAVPPREPAGTAEAVPPREAPPREAEAVPTPPKATPTPPEATPTPAKEVPTPLTPRSQRPATPVRRWGRPAEERAVEEPATHEPATHEPATHEPATHEPATHEPATHEPATDEPGGANWGVLGLAFGALVWLAATLWSAQAAIAGSAGNGPLALTAAALALPSVIAASLLAGGTVGLAIVDAAGRRFPQLTSHALPRLGTAIGGGFVVGGICAVLILAAYGAGTAILVLAVAVGLTAALGAAQAAIPWAAVVGAAFAGLLAWFVVGLIQGAYTSRLLNLFGAGNTLASQLRAQSSLSLAVAVVGGIVAGLVAFGFLRRRDRGLRWPAYLAAGAGPGLLIVAAHLVTAIGGAQLFRLAGNVSADDRAALGMLGTQRLETAEIVLFAGALAALVGFGARMRARPSREPDP
jgi:hypothetical protein